MLCEVAVALEVGEHAQRGEEDVAFIHRSNPARERVEYFTGDLFGELVDEFVLVDEAFRHFTISREERVGGPSDPLANEGEDLDEPVIRRVNGCLR